MQKLIKWYSCLNIYYQLLPFLFLYAIIVILFPKDINASDQERYLRFAYNLLNGFYSTPYPNVDLWSGPGYSIFLAPFIFFKFPFFALRLLNALLIYFSLILTYKTIITYSPPKSAYFFTILLGAFFPIYESVRQVMTESLAWFQISLICFLFVKCFQRKNISWMLICLTSLAIAYLAFVKVIFGYVIISMLFISISIWVLSAFRSIAKRSIIIFLLSFIFCLPWLFYTYSLTNKAFYWSNSGSMSLYTMSTPFAEETGQWYQESELLKNPNHSLFIDSILKLTSLQRDEAYKEAAIRNIKKYPLKYLTNCISNTGRLLFFPSDYAPDSLLSYYPFIPNMFIVVFIVLSILVSLSTIKKIPKELIFLFLFIFIYLAGSILLSTYRRMFHITMPFWFLYFSYFFNNIVSFKFIKN